MNGQRGGRLSKALGVAVLVLPFAVALSRAASAGQWRDDVSAVRDLGLVAVGTGGALSTWLAQTMSLLPLGPRTFRAALGSALALGAASWLLHRVGERVLRAARPGSPRTSTVLAAIAAFTAALSSTWEGEGTVGGGAMLAAALVLAGISAAAAEASGELERGGARTWLGLGLLTGAAMAESVAAGVCLLASLGSVFVLRRWVGGGPRKAAELPPRRVAVGALLAALFVFAALSAPVLLRPLAPREWADLGRALASSGVGGMRLSSAPAAAFEAWKADLGLLSLGIALFGGVVALGRPASRWLAAPLGVLVASDLVMPAATSGGLAMDPAMPLRALAVGALAVLSAAGVQEVVARLLVLRLPMARAAAVLVVMFDLTLIALASEEAGVAADRSARMGAEEWTDQALGTLEPSAAILVRSEAVAWRLWAARLTRGERPDVVVIPVPLLERSRMAGVLLATEPEMEPLLRDFALTREPSEFALSKLADVRALHVELDRGWSKRLIGHLVVDGMWLQFAPQPLGPSDRKQATKATLAPIGRVLAAVGANEGGDAATSTVLAGALASQATVLASLNESDAQKTFLEEVGRLQGTDGAGVRTGSGGPRETARR